MKFIFIRELPLKLSEICSSIFFESSNLLSFIQNDSGIMSECMQADCNNNNDYWPWLRHTVQCFKPSHDHYQLIPRSLSAVKVIIVAPAEITYKRSRLGSQNVVKPSAPCFVRLLHPSTPCFTLCCVCTFGPRAGQALLFWETLCSLQSLLLVICLNFLCNAKYKGIQGPLDTSTDVIEQN